MGRLRVTVAGLMGLVVVLGAGLAALKNASELWALAVRLFVLGLLATAILGALYRRGARRAWWVGFALFGWGYEAMECAPWSPPETPSSRALLEGLYARLSPRRVLAVDSFTAAALAQNGQILDPRPNETQGVTPDAAEQVVVVGTLDATAFRAIGRHLLALAAAVVGGLIAVRFHATSE